MLYNGTETEFYIYSIFGDKCVHRINAVDNDDEKTFISENFRFFFYSWRREGGEGTETEEKNTIK